MIAEFYHMYSKELLFLIASLFLYIICRYFNQGETQLVKLISQPIHLPFSQMEKICNETILQNTEILETERYKLIHYIDSESCVVCELKAMYQWNDFLIKTGLEKSVQLYYIIDTRNHNRKELIAAINKTYIQGEGYFDNTGIFRITNEFIPSNKFFHTFLLDHNNNVIVAGNPLNNPKIEKLLIETIDNMNNKSNNVLSK